ncbi:MAG: hypothetical protein AAFQ07_17755, partial [Chloroflexota bacterium]
MRNKPVYINPWTWFYDFQRQAIANRQVELLRLPRKYHEAWRYLEAAQYDDALRLFNEGIDIANELQQPMWIYFFESWLCEVYVLADDYDRALEATTRLVAKSPHPQFRDHPVQAVVYFTLAWVYSYVDGVGYQEDIIAALDTIEGGEIPLDEETHQRSIYLRAKIAFENENFDDARDYNEDYMSRVSGNPFRESSGYGMRRALAFRTGDLPAALSAAQLQEGAARQTRLLNNVIHSMLWQGILHYFMDDTVSAEQIIQRAIDERNARKLTEKVTFHHLLALYHRIRGDLDKALTIRDDELVFAIESKSLSFEFRSRLYRCYLLNALKRDANTEIADLEALAQKSKVPRLLMERVNEVKAGRTIRYDWLA